MAVTGPTSASITPNPYTDSVTISWSGLSITGQDQSHTYLNFKYRTSSDNANWGEWSTRHGYYNPPSSGSITFPGTYSAMAGMANIPQGHYVQFSIHANGYTASGTERFVTTQKQIVDTACTAPTALNVNTTLSEGNATLSWSGAAAGTNNPISGYEIQYSDSSDNSSWGSWTGLSTQTTTGTSGSLSVAPPGTRGSYRRFRIRTLTANTTYYSGWRTSGNTVRRNTLPSAPTSFTASPASYITEDITLSWSGAAAGTSDIKQYVIQKAESNDNATWGIWQNVQTVASTATSGSVVVSPTRVKDVYTLYRICTQDKLDCLSSYRNSNSVYSIPLPAAPEIAAPKTGGITYNRNPKVLIQTVAPPGGREQTVFAMGTDGNVYNSVDHSGMFSVSGVSTGAIKTIFTNPDTGPSSFNVSVHCKTTDAGPATTRVFSVAVPPYIEKISVGMKVKATHITSMQTAINAVRDYYGLAAWPWGYPITPGRTNIAYWPFHIRELRAAIQAVIVLLAQYGGTPGVEWLDIGTGRPRADVMNQLQDVILSL